ncbi:PhzF family phenazine biosynthesis protein [Agaribacter flavus]|uniref:PhzF family phenazine biosynthesis protein n=1 Tax=Agaribacter flavus TaxID=1902781 RepID=A0ABV7FW09_9ALTE
MELQRIAAFCEGQLGGNPAGVMLLDTPLSSKEMARIAADVGYSETVFATPLSLDRKSWKVRYFSPESEVPFCGHATIALGAALGEREGEGTYQLVLNDAHISVETEQTEQGFSARLQSPNTHSQALQKDALLNVLNLFSLSISDLDPRLAPSLIHGGANHIAITLKSRQRLKSMSYNLDEGRSLMRELGIVTVMLVFIESEQIFNVRNAFASGGVFEDPATGAAAAAFAGYLRDINWPHGGSFTIKQGQDMGQPSIIQVDLTNQQGSPVFVSGLARTI